MTDAFPPDDELISSYLDGEATPDQVARVEASPELVARSSDLRAAIRLTATPVSSPDGNMIDEMIAGALNAGGVPDNITDLATARRRSVPKAVLVAAAVVLVALSIPAIKLVSGSSTGSYSASAPTAGAESATGVAADSLGGGDSAPKELELSATTTVAAATTAAPALNFAPADLAESTGVDETGLSPDAVRLAIPGLPPFDKTIFDPLPAVLAPVSDLTSLEVILTGALSNTPQPASEAPAPSSPIDPLLCSDSIATFLESNPIGVELATSNAVADFAQVEIGGAVHWLSLIRLSPTRAVALVINATTCTPVTLINLAP